MRCETAKRSALEEVLSQFFHFCIDCSSSFFRKIRFRPFVLILQTNKIVFFRVFLKRVKLKACLSLKNNKKMDNNNNAGRLLNALFHLQRTRRGTGRQQQPTPSAATSNESRQASRLVQIWKTFIAPRPSSIMCVLIAAALMQWDIGWPPRLQKFAVRRCALAGDTKDHF